MDEAAQMLRSLGIAPRMTENTAVWQQALGALGIAPPPEGFEAKLAAAIKAGVAAGVLKGEN
jgi:hypothetical protein